MENEQPPQNIKELLNMLFDEEILRNEKETIALLFESVKQIHQEGTLERLSEDLFMEKLSELTPYQKDVLLHKYFMGLNNLHASTTRLEMQFKALEKLTTDMIIPIIQL